MTEQEQQVVVAFDGARPASGVAMTQDAAGNWRVLGYLEEDGLHPLPPAAPTWSETMARINETIAEVTMCACGCRRAITEDSASPFFASPGCQRRWHASSVDDPAAVYGRRDAAPVYGRADGMRVPLNEPRQAPTTTGPEEGWLPVPPGSDAHRAAWRRACPSCTALVIPQAFQREPRGEHGDPVWAAGASIRLDCPRCARTLLAPHFIGTVYEHPDKLVLELRDHQTRIRRTVLLSQLAAAPDPEALIRAVWAALERQLTRFNRGFTGRPR